MKKTLYVQRKVLNPEPIYAWAEQNGIVNLTDIDEMHVTVAFSKTPVFHAQFAPDQHKLKVSQVDRSLDLFGTTLVLKLSSNHLQNRWQYYMDGGCSYDFPSYQPHISIAKDCSTLPLSLPYDGEILLDVETMKEIKAEYLTPKDTDLDTMVEAALRVSFIDSVIPVVRELKFTIQHKDALTNSLTIKHKSMIIIIDPNEVSTIFYIDAPSLGILSPGLATVPTPKSPKGIASLLRKHLVKYEKTTDLVKTYIKLSDKLERIKTTIKVNGVVDRYEGDTSGTGN